MTQKKFLDPNNFFALKNFFDPKTFLIPKKNWPKKLFRLNFFFGPEKLFWLKKCFWPEKPFWPKAYPAQTFSNRAYSVKCVSSELLRACFMRNREGFPKKSSFLRRPFFCPPPLWYSIYFEGSCSCWRAWGEDKCSSQRDGEKTIKIYIFTWIHPNIKSEGIRGMVGQPLTLT